MRRAALVVLLCAAVDVAATRHDVAHRPPSFTLVWQALLLWSAAAALAALPALLVKRLVGSFPVALLICLAGPVLAHDALRDALRAGELARWSSWGPVAARLGALALAGFVWRRVELVPSGGLRATAGALCLLAAGWVLWPVAPEPERGPAGPPGRPNLLLLVWDTTRADHLLPYGYDRETTPHLAALAERGTVFEHCFSPSVFTLSSHVSLLSGQPPSLHGTGMRRQRVGALTAAGILRRAGYRTGAFVGTSVLAAGRGLERGFEVYDDLVDPPVCDTRLWSLVHDLQVVAAAWIPAARGNGLPHWFQDFQRPAGEVLASARAFVEADDPRPWFALVNLFDVHWPYLPARDAHALWVRDYDGPLDGYLFRSDAYPPDYEPLPDDARHLRDLYDAEMWDLDRAVNRFLGALDLDETAVVLTSDHGEALGENAYWSHEDLHAPQTRVPLVVCAPGRAPAGERVAEPVSGLDVLPTLLGIAGVPVPEDVVLAGRDLLAGPVPDDRTIVIEDHDNLDPAWDGDAVVRGRFKLLADEDGVGLHDWASDPFGERDLSAEHPEVAAELAGYLETLHAVREEDADGLQNVDALRALGYLGERR